MIRVEFDKTLAEKAIQAIAQGKPIQFGEENESWTQSRAIQAAAILMDVAFHFGPGDPTNEQINALPAAQRKKLLDQFSGDVIAAAVHCMVLTQSIRQRKYDERFNPKLKLEVESKGQMPITVRTEGLK